MRVVCYVLSVMIFALLVLKGIMVVMSLGPEPGDKMILMGLPMLALPQRILCIVLLALVHWMGRSMPKAERWVFTALNLSFLCVFIMALIFG